MADYTLILGDCLEKMREIEDNSVDVVIADPPYGIDYQSSWRTDKEKWIPKIKNDTSPFIGWGDQVRRIVKRRGGVVLVFYRWDVQQSFISELNSNNDMVVKSQIVWDKLSHGMGDLRGGFAPQHENILFARRSGFEFPGNRPTTILRCEKVPPAKQQHPNEKPVNLLMKLIEFVSKKGDIVLDFTMGSGTTGVAALRTGRNFIGIELDPDYFKIAETRIKNAAGDFVRTEKEVKSGQMSIWD